MPLRESSLAFAARDGQISRHAAAVLGRSRVLEVPEPTPLRSSTWAQWLYASAAVLSLPAQFVIVLLAAAGEDELSFVLGSLSAAMSLLLLVAVVLWTWVNVDNSRRLLAHSRHRSKVSPWRGVFWWLAVALVGLPLIWAGRWMSDRYIVGSDRFGRDADVVQAFLAFAIALVVLALWVRPYLYLGSVMRRIRGESSLFVRWLWLPLVTFIVVVAATVALSLAGALQPESTMLAFGFAILGLATLPYIVWCWSGWRALSGMDITLRARSARQHEERALYLATERSAELSTR